MMALTDSGVDGAEQNPAHHRRDEARNSCAMRADRGGP